MKNTVSQTKDAPGRPYKHGYKLVRKEVSLLPAQVEAIEKKARETIGANGKPQTFADALRDVVGYWMEWDGKRAK